MTPGAWGRLWAAVEDGDLIRAAIFLSRKVRFVQLDRVLVIEADVRADRPMLRRLREREAGLAVRQAGGCDLPDLQRLFPHHAGRYAVRLERGDDCLLVETPGSPIAMGWVRYEHRAGIDEMECTLYLAEDACWGHDTFVLPEHRSRGAFAVLMWEMFERLKARGLRAMYASVAWENISSRASHERLGYSTALRIDRLILAGTHLYRFTRPGSAAVWRRRRRGRAVAWRLE